MERVIVERIIDLDRAAVPAPVREFRLSPRWRRAIAVALGAAAVTLGLAAAAPPAPGPLRDVATVRIPPVITQTLAGGSLYAVVQSPTPHLTEYRLRDGARRWSTALPAPADPVGVTVVAGVALVSLAGRPATVAVDTGTGRELWRSDLTVLPGLGTAGEVILGASLSPYGQLVTELVPDPVHLRAVDPGSGRPLWTYDVPGGWWTALPYDPFNPAPGDLMVTLSPQGLATVVDLGTGRVRRTAHIPVGTTRHGTVGTGPLLALRSGQLLVGHLARGQSTLDLYRVDRLTARWTATVPSVNIGVAACGGLLCLFDQDGIRAVRPADGTVAWRAPVTGWAGFLGGRLYYAPGPFQPGSARLVEPGSGRTALDLGPWRLAVRVSDRPLLLEAAEVRTQRLWLGLLVDGPRIRRLGVVSGLPQNSCDASAEYLACLTNARQLRIWRIGP